MSEWMEQEKVSTEMGRLVLTVGHSTLPVQEFIALLRENGVSRIIDVRTIPRSRHNPQFNRDTFPENLAQAGIRYTHMPGLGGLRHAKADSPNRGWRNDSFRGFADYMQTDEFANSIEQLLEYSSLERVALMCAEAVPWRCHRSLIADALLLKGVRIVHIIGKAKRVDHKITPFARIDGVTITYPAEPRIPDESP